MREELQEIDKVRDVFTGIFERYGAKQYIGPPKKTILLKDIKDKNNNVVADHLWFNETKEFKELTLEKGDVVEFKARVKEYYKGYKGYREDVYNPVEQDYKLNYPTQIKIIGKIAPSEEKSKPDLKAL